MLDADDRLTGAEAARLAGVTTDTVRKWHRLGKLAHVGRQPGTRGRWLYRRGDVEELLRVPAPPSNDETAIVRAQLTAFFKKREAAAKAAKAK
jgi:predicted site-specific integrase-resolvase